MNADQKGLLAAFWQRRSERGNEYLSGFLGKARIVAFRGEPMADGVPTWDLYLTPGKEQEEGLSRAPVRRASETRGRRHELPAGAPFHDDSIDDIGRPP